MSVVLEPEDSGDELIMYTKGADNVIFEKVKGELLQVLPLYNIKFNKF